MLFLVLIFVYSCSICWGLRGVDLILPLSVQQWADLKVDFAVVRVVKHTGVIDYTGIKNLRRAQEANITDLSGYMYPCIPTSYFAQVEGIECLSAAGQLDALMAAMDVNAVNFEQYQANTWPPTNAPTHAPTVVSAPTRAPTYQFQPSFAPSSQPSSQPSGAPTGKPTSSPVRVLTTAAPTCLPTSTPTSTPPPTFAPTRSPTRSPSHLPTSMPSNLPGTKPLAIKRVYLMVEDESPPRYFDADQKVNQAYFMELASRAYENGIQLGVFTTLRYWSELMVTVAGQTMSFSRDNIPLWMPRFDRQPTMEFFVPFGGWSRVQMKQYWGGSSPARRLDSTWRLNDNYIEYHLNDTSIDAL